MKCDTYIFCRSHRGIYTELVNRACDVVPKSSVDTLRSMNKKLHSLAAKSISSARTSGMKRLVVHELCTVCTIVYLTETRYLPGFLVNSTQAKKQFSRFDHGLSRRGGQVIEGHYVIHPQRLQL